MSFKYKIMKFTDKIVGLVGAKEETSPAIGVVPVSDKHVPKQADVDTAISKGVYNAYDRVKHDRMERMIAERHIDAVQRGANYRSSFRFGSPASNKPKPKQADGNKGTIINELCASQKPKQYRMELIDSIKKNINKEVAYCGNNATLDCIIVDNYHAVRRIFKTFELFSEYAMDVGESKLGRVWARLEHGDGNFTFISVDARYSIVYNLSFEEFSEYCSSWK